MRKTTRRTISFLLAALMLLSLFPASAMAMPDLGTYEAETAPPSAAAAPEETPGALLWPLAAGAVMLHNADTPEAAEAAETTAEPATIGIAPLAVAGLGPLPTQGPGGTTTPGQIATHPHAIIRANAAAPVFVVGTVHTGGTIRLTNTGNRNISSFTVPQLLNVQNVNPGGALNVGQQRNVSWTPTTWPTNTGFRRIAVNFQPQGGGVNSQASHQAVAYASANLTSRHVFWLSTIELGGNWGRWDLGTWAWAPTLSASATNYWGRHPVGLEARDWIPEAHSGAFTITQNTGLFSITAPGALTSVAAPANSSMTVAVSGNAVPRTTRASAGRINNDTHGVTVEVDAVISVLDWFPNPTAPTIVSSNPATRSVTLSEGPAFATHNNVTRPHAQRQWRLASINGVATTETARPWQTSRTFTNLPAGELRFVYRTALTAGDVQYVVNANRVSAQSESINFNRTVTFDLNGGNPPAPATQTVLSGGTATRPTPNPTRDGYTFRGWYVADAQLVITREVHGGFTSAVGTTSSTPYNNTNVYTRLTQSALRGTLNTWGANNLAPELRARALEPVGVDDDVRNAPDWGTWLNTQGPHPNVPGQFENQAIGRTTPGAPTPGNAANGSLFVLSVSEVHEYFEGGGTLIDVDRIAGCHNTGNPTTAGTTGRDRLWWLRSPGNNAIHIATVFEDGSVSPAQIIAATVGFRPALWVVLDAGADALAVGDTFIDSNGIFWRVLAEDLIPFDFSTPITRDTTLVAMWDADHQVTFDLNGADTPASIPTQHVPDGDTATEPTPDPTRDGYTFRGWYVGSEEIWWRVLAEDAQGRHLIITREAHGGWTTESGTFSETPYNLANEHTPFTQSNLHTLMTAWGAVNLAPELRANALEPNGVDSDVRTAPNWGTWPSTAGLHPNVPGRFENEAIGRTTPGAPTPGVAANSSLFALSISEVHEYFDGAHILDDADRMSYCHNTGINTASGSTGVPRDWWLRSPGTNAAQPVAGVSNVVHSGRISHTTSPNRTMGFRPALWVDADTVSVSVGETFVTSSGNLTPFDFNTPITEDTHLIAMWDEIPDVTVTFDLNGADTPASIPNQTFAPGGTATEPTPDPTRDGYTFAGWYTREARETFTADDIAWRVLYDRGDGYRLLITDRVHAVGTHYNTANVYTRLAQSNARVALNNWWNTNVAGTSLVSAAVPVLNAENDVRDEPGGTMIVWVHENEPDGITTPGSGPVAANGSDALFLLSVSEVNLYWPSTNAPPQWSQSDARIAYEHLYGGVANWWLRSPGLSASDEPVAGVLSNGQVASRDANTPHIGLRPALWIYGDILGEDGSSSLLYEYVRFDFSTPIYEDTHLIARWDAVHDVTFDLNGADTPASIPTQTVPDGETATEPTPPPTRDGYTFRGWYTREVADTFMDGDIGWRVLHDRGDGHYLIITERVHTNGPYNTTNVYTRLAQSNLRSVLNTWWGANVSTVLRGVAVPANNVENDLRNAGQGLWPWDQEGVNGPPGAGFTYPGSGTVAPNGSNALFILSTSELNYYFEDTNAARQAPQAEDGSAVWWLRSPGLSTNGVMAIVNSNGGRATTSAVNDGIGARPALWIQGDLPGFYNYVPFDFSTPIHEDTHLIAMWDADGYEFQITFHMYDGSDDYEVVEVIPGEALDLTDLADRGIPVAHILGTPEASGWALWGWFSDAQLDPATTGRPLRNGFRRPVVGATGFPIGAVITQTMIDDLFDADGNLDLFVIWSLWGDANDDDRVDAADVLQMQRHLHDLLMDLIGQPRTWDVTINQIAANVTVSGTVGAADILRIERHLHDLLMDMIGQPRIWDIVLGRP